jgi:thiamine pyrophosphokinase
VSLFNFTCTHITSIGLLYPIYPFTQLWQGTLNEMTADTFEINADGQYLVYLVTE